MSGYFSGFSLHSIDAGDGPIRLRVGGSGPAVMLLHGHPRTHATWDRVAVDLARDFTVICPDLPGFGGSFQPIDMPDHAGSSKRAKAAALARLMTRLGHERFFLAGHDRGAPTAFRLAMDHPHRVSALAQLDGIPIIEHLERADWRFARDWWHWFFYAQPAKPEGAIAADPEAWYAPGPRPHVAPEAQAEWLAAIRDPAVVHGMIEDYRAGLTVDHIHDRADRDARRRLGCLVTVLWSLRDDLAAIYGDPLAIWRAWADEVSGHGIDSTHHMAEEAPEAVADALRRAFQAREYMPS
ncbi:alpha/beta hydrolase [Paracoccus suum]|uniref:Alpha/beta hydrolase n=1 Tax=Paracoccus suum TaxID=2259340 RepID=A0A344PNH1_9RHOB|nr:alpha/beta hydrolase [Paracoccus suum]AXC50926.1 alpha/beta hydrolase [Paracoccus suum]